MVPPVMVLHAVLDLGRIARHVESGVEGVPVAAPWLMSEVAKALTPQRRLTNMWVLVGISGGREETSHASSVFLSCFCFSLFSGGYCQELPLLCHTIAKLASKCGRARGPRRSSSSVVRLWVGAVRPRLFQRSRRRCHQLHSPRRRQRRPPHHRQPHLLLHLAQLIHSTALSMQRILGQLIRKSGAAGFIIAAAHRPLRPSRFFHRCSRFFNQCSRLFRRCSRHCRHDLQIPTIATTVLPTGRPDGLSGKRSGAAGSMARVVLTRVVGV